MLLIRLCQAQFGWVLAQKRALRQNSGLLGADHISPAEGGRDPAAGCAVPGHVQVERVRAVSRGGEPGPAARIWTDLDPATDRAGAFVFELSEAGDVVDRGFRRVCRVHQQVGDGGPGLGAGGGEGDVDGAEVAVVLAGCLGVGRVAERIHRSGGGQRELGFGAGPRHHLGEGGAAGVDVGARHGALGDLAAGDRLGLQLGGGHRVGLDLRGGDRVLLQLVGADAVLGELRGGECSTSANQQEQA